MPSVDFSHPFPNLPRINKLQYVLAIDCRSGLDQPRIVFCEVEDGFELLAGPGLFKPDSRW